MVGTKKWEDAQITLIVTSKAKGLSVPLIIDELKKRWPRRIFNDSGVRYVLTNYKEGPP